MSARVASIKPGDKIGEWTVLELRTDATSARERKWLIRCNCGFQAFRTEYSLRNNKHSVACGSCTSIRIAAAARGLDK